MTMRKNAGNYLVGRIKTKRDGPRPRRCGDYGVIKGENIASNNHLEWCHICPGIVKKSLWCAYRIGPGDNGKGTRTDLIQAFDTKSEAVDFLKSRYGNKFDVKY